MRIHTPDPGTHGLSLRGRLLSQALRGHLHRRGHALVPPVPRQTGQGAVQDTLTRAALPPRPHASGSASLGLGLPEALRRLSDNAERLFNVECTFQEVDTALVHDNTTATHLYRIAQEAVRNAVTHANASHVDLYLGMGVDQAPQEEATDSRETEASENIILRVEDDGRGMPEAACETLTGASGQEGGAGVETDASNPGIGLHLMQYRADLIGARLTVESTDGEGTTVTCEVPLGTEGG